MSDPSDSKATERPASPSGEEKIEITIKANNDTKYTISVPVTTSVADLKKLLHEQHREEIPAEPRLIFSGRVLKNHDTLDTYKVKTGNTIHMVRPAPSNRSTTAANAGGSATLPRNLAAGSGNNPLAGLTGARYAGHAQLPSADIFGPDGGMGPPPDPENLAQAMSNPQFQQQMNELLQNPQLLDYIIASNPMLQSLGPDARQLMQSPMFRSMMTNPDVIRQMSSMGGVLGGSRQFPGAGGAAFPEPGRTDNTPGATPSATGEGQQAGQSPAAGQPPANPFAAMGANPFASMFPFGAGAPPAGSGSEGAPPGLPMNPAALQQLMAALGGGTPPAGGDPAAPGATPNPFAGLFGGMGGLPAGGMGGFGAAPAAPVDNRPPEERYADQLRQLNDMGFFDFDRNVEALRRSGGSVQGAVNQLLGG
ncbi:hypothetical protein EDC01DRAFT_194581 [Geopyxis carbonaria]|nr:hypothetical protein EDC01DRAFT_194581 [Geopyxis carbonaria]